MDWIVNNLTAVVGFLALVVSLGIFYWNFKKEEKKISYEILTDNQLIDDSLLENDIKITYEKKDLSNLRIIIFRIVNDGFKSITIDEYNSNITIFFGNDAAILSHELIKIVPNYLPVEYNTKGHTLCVEPLMLNRGDSFEIKLLITDGNIQKPIPEVRIKGIKEFTIYKKTSLIKHTNSISAMCLILGVTLLPPSIFIIIDNTTSQMPIQKNAINLFIIGIVLILCYFAIKKIEKYLRKTAV